MEAVRNPVAGMLHVGEPAGREAVAVIEAGCFEAKITSALIIPLANLSGNPLPALTQSAGVPAPVESDQLPSDHLVHDRHRAVLGQQDQAALS